MEALAPTMEEGRVAKWHKREGDAVKAGETLAEVETDKAVMDLVARADGVLRPGGGGRGATGAGGGGGGGGRREAGRAVAVAPPTPATTTVPAGDASRVKASPLAKRIAKEAGVDLKLVTGSGPGGRVVKRDIEATGRSVQVPAPVATVAVPHPASRIPHPDRTGTPYDDVPLTQIRKTIAKRLATSLGPIPHFFLTSEVDMERAAEAREALNKQLGDRGSKVSFNDIVIKATALALVKHRACNAWFQEDHIRYWNEVHIGMAVAVEDGLITPVIRNADAKSLAEIGREAKELADKARSRRLQPGEYTGATFSVSNLGMFDIDQFTAVINPPEAGIVAVGSIVQKPVVL